MLELREAAAESGVELSRATSDASCAGCGALGTGVGARTTTRRSSQGKAKGSVLRRRCDTCATVHRRYIGKKPRERAVSVGTTASPSLSSSTASTTATKLSRKKRKKAKGKATAVLHDAGKETTLSLSDFLSSIK